MATPEILLPDSWSQRISNAHLKKQHRKNIVDDGFYSHMAKNASFTKGLEFPIIKDPGVVQIPDGAIPFSKMGRSANHSECVVFFEKDPLFANVLVSVDDFADDLAKHPCIATPDCSLYRDSPLAVQLSNIYLNRLVGRYCQELGMTVIPTCRWGDERTYTNQMFKTPPAFDGLPRESIYWVGTYGVSKRKDDRKHLRAGLENMLKWLHPKTVLLYGSKPRDVFSELDSNCNFVLFQDWTTVVKSGDPRG